MELSVLIVSWNTRELLEACLSALFARAEVAPSIHVTT